jgi:hypothetical protein
MIGVESKFLDVSLTDGVVMLRRWATDDLPCIEEAGTDPYIPAITTVPVEWSVASGQAFIEQQWSRSVSGEGISLAIHSSELGRAVGLVSMMLRPQPDVIGLGYWVVPSARGRGLAGRAALLAKQLGVGVGGLPDAKHGWNPTTCLRRLCCAEPALNSKVNCDRSLSYTDGVSTYSCTPDFRRLDGGIV